MKRRNWCYALVFLSGALLSGCAFYEWHSVPAQQQVSNEYFNADITPICHTASYGYQEFRLSIQNKTDKNIEVNWNKTLYMAGGQTSGGFMFEGVMYINRDNPKPPDIVFAHSSFSKTIWPCHLVHLSSGQYGGWFNGPMPEGENGVYLSVTVDGKEVTERLTVNLSATQIQ